MKRVAMVVSTIGYHWEEVYGGYWAFKDAGYEVELYTVNGQSPRADAMSLKPTGPLAAFGLGLASRIAPETPRGRLLEEALASSRALAAIAPERLDTLYLPGGHGCLFDVNRNAALHEVVRALYLRNCILGAVCHATSTFAFVNVGGESIVRGHAMTGFPHALDRTLIALGLVREEFLPLPLINDHELRQAGAELSAFDEARAYVDPRFMQVSRPFVTGVGPKAAARVAKTMVRLIGEEHAPARPLASASATL